MVEKDVGKMLYLIQTEYPTNFKGMTVEQMSVKKELWFEMFKNDDARIVINALKVIISKSKYPPTIAEIRRAMVENTIGSLNLSAEAWEEVTKTIQHFGYVREKEAMESLAPMTAKAVRCMGGYQCLCQSEDSMADRAHFVRFYESIAEKSTQEKLVPIALAEEIKETIALNKPKKEIRLIQQEKKEEEIKSGVPKEFTEALELMKQRMKVGGCP